MPEQFSEEYAAEVRKHPWLQEMWTPEPPDLFWIDGNIFVITFVSELGDVDAKCIHGPVIGLAHCRSDSQFFQARQRGDIVWLPTLGELIEIAKNLALRGNVIGLRLDYWAVEEIYEWALKKMTSGNIHHSFPGASEDCYDAKIALINLLAAREGSGDA